MKVSRAFYFISFVSLLIFIASCNNHPLDEPSLESLALRHSYTRQFGTTRSDEPTSTITDASGNVYIAVNIRPLSLSERDEARIYKYNSGGNLLGAITPPYCCGYWYSYTKGLAIDVNGSLYLAGDTDGHLLSYTQLVKYGANGNILWSKQLQEAPNSNGDPTRVHAYAVATDAKGNAYFMFEKRPYPYQFADAYLRKYNPLGKLLWEKVVGSSSTSLLSQPTMTSDKQGNVYMSMGINYISRYDPQGNFLWSSQAIPLGVYAYIRSIATDANGYVYLAGITNGNLEGTNQGAFDAFLRKYDRNGNILWTRQFGTTGSDWANALTIDTTGNIYIAGSTEGSLQTNVVNRGNYDAYLRQFDQNGNAVQTKQFGSTSFDTGDQVAVDNIWNVYITGRTTGKIPGGTRVGNQDAYIRKYTP
jgi:hypothetical protein